MQTPAPNESPAPQGCREFLSSSEKETAEIAFSLASAWDRPAALCLDGPLGAGKTKFVSGLAAALSSPHLVASPTFPLVHEYSGGRLPLFHFDFYRLRSEEEVWDLGFEDYLKDGIVAVEWGSKFLSVFPPHSLLISITPLSPSSRTIRVSQLFPTFP